MKFLAIVLTILYLFSLLSAAESDSGTVCVAAKAVTPSHGQAPPKKNSVGLNFKIDNRKPVPWPQRESLKVNGLTLGERHHVVVLNSSSKLVESQWFRFSAVGSNDLCMAYDGYQGVSLQDVKEVPWCKCK